MSLNCFRVVFCIYLFSSLSIDRYENFSFFCWKIWIQFISVHFRLKFGFDFLFLWKWNFFRFRWCGLVQIWWIGGFIECSLSGRRNLIWIIFVRVKLSEWFSINWVKIERIFWESGGFLKFVLFKGYREGGALNYSSRW